MMRCNHRPLAKQQLRRAMSIADGDFSAWSSVRFPTPPKLSSSSWRQGLLDADGLPPRHNYERECHNLRGPGSALARMPALPMAILVVGVLLGLATAGVLSAYRSLSWGLEGLAAVLFAMGAALVLIIVGAAGLGRGIAAGGRDAAG